MKIALNGPSLILVILIGIGILLLIMLPSQIHPPIPEQPRDRIGMHVDDITYREKQDNSNREVVLSFNKKTLTTEWDNEHGTHRLIYYLKKAIVTSIEYTTVILADNSTGTYWHYFKVQYTMLHDCGFRNTSTLQTVDVDEYTEHTQTMKYTNVHNTTFLVVLKYYWDNLNYFGNVSYTVEKKRKY